MLRTRLLLLPSLALLACERTSGIQVVETCYPQLTASTEWVEFGSVAWGEASTQRVVLKNDGEMPMGVGTIALGTDEMEDNFSIAYSFDDVQCPPGAGGNGGGSGGDGGADGGDDTAAAELSPVSLDADTGDYYSDYGTDSGRTQTDDDRVIPAGCTLPIDVTVTPEQVGAIYGSLRIQTTTESVDEDAEDPVEPTYFADPDSDPVVILLHAEADKGAPNIFVKPRALDFGTIWEGDSASLLVDVQNTGEAELTLKAPYLDETCDPGFSIDWAYGADTVLAGDALTGVEVTFTPESDDDAHCVLWVESDDPDEPFIDINMEANEGGNAAECAPTVNLIAPTVGYEHLSGSDLEVVFEVYDCNEPAQNLELQIRSGVLSADDPVLVDTFHAQDESGYVEATVPRDQLGRGTDTLIVRVTDSAGNRTQASTTVLYRATYPPSDDDGDGFGTEDKAALDCDDGNIRSYPGAQEVYDGSDNDCDGVIDEGTEGYDDDGDGWSEVDGDCNDADEESNPEADELPDFDDNDCDGDIDENTTQADDDDDGFAEYEGDCDDGDAEINPLATEFCDGLDNDCNGIMDERDGCVDLTSEPIIIGGVRAAATAIRLGETVTLEVFVHDADGDPTYYAWQQDPVLTQRGWVGIDNPSGQTVTFTAPSSFPDEDTVSETYNMKVIVMDPAGSLDSTDLDITVYAGEVPVCVSDENELTGDSGCGSKSGVVLVPGALVALLAAARRRRRDIASA